MKKKKAFTIVELLVVITILAILSAVGLFGYQTIIKNTKTENDKNKVASLNLKLQQHQNQILGFENIKERLEYLVSSNLTNSFKTENLDNIIVYNNSTNQFVLIDSNNNILFGDKSKAINENNAYNYYTFITEGQQLSTTLNNYIVSDTFSFPDEFLASSSIYFNGDINSKVTLVKKADLICNKCIKVICKGYEHTLSGNFDSVTINGLKIENNDLPSKITLDNCKINNLKFFNDNETANNYFTLVYQGENSIEKYHQEGFKTGLLAVIKCEEKSDVLSLQVTNKEVYVTSKVNRVDKRVNIIDSSLQQSKDIYNDLTETLITLDELLKDQTVSLIDLATLKDEEFVINDVVSIDRDLIIDLAGKSFTINKYVLINRSRNLNIISSKEDGILNINNSNMDNPYGIFIGNTENNDLVTSLTIDKDVTLNINAYKYGIQFNSSYDQLFLNGCTLNVETTYKTVGTTETSAIFVGFSDISNISNDLYGLISIEENISFNYEVPENIQKQDIFINSNQKVKIKINNQINEYNNSSNTIVNIVLEEKGE